MAFSGLVALLACATRANLGIGIRVDVTPDVSRLSRDAVSYGTLTRRDHLQHTKTTLPLTQVSISCSSSCTRLRDLADTVALPRGNCAALDEDLPTTVQLHILSFLAPNDRALSGRLAFRDAHDAFPEPEDCTASLYQPLPPHAKSLAIAAGKQHVRQRAFDEKLQLMCTAAASGSEVNLEVALELVKPSLFPDTVQAGTCAYLEDAGVAAVKAGHPQLLGWLLRRCPGFSRPFSALTAAAQHCNLAGLQATWDTLHAELGPGGISSSTSGRHRPVLSQWVLDAAARSATPDAVAKMEWVLQGGVGSCSLKVSTAEAAASSGDLGRLRWLHDRGCPMGGLSTLGRALQHGEIAVTAWLVDEAGCELPPPAANGQDDSWEPLMRDVVSRPDAMARLAWLHGRGAPSLTELDDSLMEQLLLFAAREGQLEVVRHVLVELGRTRVLATHPAWFGNAAAASGSIPVAELLRQAGAVFTPEAHENLLGHADMLGMLRWLVNVAGVPLSGMRQVCHLIENWTCKTPAERRVAREAMHSMMEGLGKWAGGVNRWEASALLASAACTGDLAMLQYLQQQLQPRGVRVDEHTVDAASKGGCEAMLEWLVEIEPGCARSRFAYRFAAFAGDRATLVALRRLGVPWGRGDTLVNAADEGSGVEVLRWLAEQGAPVGSAAEMEQVLQRPGSWLYDEGVKAWLRGLAAAAAAGQA